MSTNELLVTSNQPNIDIYGGRDPREIPAYRLADAASYLRIPKTTLRAWIKGTYYGTGAHRKFFKPVFSLPEPDTSPFLSYTNLVEAFVLSGLRRKHRIDLYKIRTAILSLQERFNSQHPLAEHQFQTHGADLFVEEYGQLINVGQGWRFAMKQILKDYLLASNMILLGRLLSYIRLSE